MNAESRIGYIYRLYGYDLNYYGSTIQLLNDRIWSHKSDYRRWKSGKRKDKCYSFEILEKGDEWTYEVVDTILTDINKTGLLEKEQIWIDNNECVNKFNAITNNNYKKEYQRKWAENKRRENGVEKKEKIKTADEKIYKKEKAREYRANMTEEKHQELLLQKKEAYDNDKQKEYVNRPEVKAKRLADQQKKRNAVKLFNLLPFAT